MLFNITEQNHLFSKFLRPVTIILVFMSLQRGLYEVVAGLNATSPISLGQHVEIYFTGLRFDLLVCSFSLLPLFGFLLTKFKLSSKVFITQLYLSLIWLGFSAVNLLNLPFFALNGKHLNWPEWQMLNAVEIFSEWLSGSNFFLKILVMGFTLLSWVLGLMELHQARLNAQRSLNPSADRKKILLRFVLILLIIAFCARGKVGAHHLRREDSQITLFPEWNELALNAQWSFNKDDR